ncbi:hypothetical protein C8Q70DRAFT_934293 [Cubamyces menziesii]|nr:hypothetical protein C8Q70DRAFT_934293 [Cubamyces menziesii]
MATLNRREQELLERERQLLAREEELRQREQRFQESVKALQLQSSHHEATERQLGERLQQLESLVNQMGISQTTSQSERSRSRRRDGGRSTSRRARGRHPEASPHADALDDTLPETDWDEVMHLGKQFLVVGELWFLPSYDDFFKKPRTNLDLFDSRRFRVIQPEKLVPWTIEELYVWVPDVYHNLLEKYDDFKNVFLEGHNDLRSNVIKTIRTHGSSIFDVRPEWLARNTDTEKDQEPLLLRYLKWQPDKPDSDYADFPPLLYPDCIKNDLLLFRNIQLVKILKAVLYGPSSINVDMKKSRPTAKNKKGQKGRSHPLPGKATNAQIWGLREVTPGMIAFSAIVATFVLSADTTFIPNGDVTGIDYWYRFQQYKKTLVSTWSLAQTQATVQFFQAELFPQQCTPDVDQHINSDGEDAADAMIRLMRESAAAALPQDDLSPAALSDPLHPSASTSPSLRTDNIPPMGANQGARRNTGRAANVQRAPPESNTSRGRSRSSRQPIDDVEQHAADPAPAPPPRRHTPNADSRSATSAPSAPVAPRPPARRARPTTTPHDDDADAAESRTHSPGPVGPRIPEVIPEEDELEDLDGVEDYDATDYVEVDIDEQTDLDAGFATDSSEDVPRAPTHAVRPQGSMGSVGLPVVSSTAPRSAYYSHRPNAPPVIHSSKSIPAPQTLNSAITFDPFKDGRRMPSTATVAAMARSLSGPVPRASAPAPMARSFSMSSEHALPHAPPAPSYILPEHNVRTQQAASDDLVHMHTTPPDTAQPPPVARPSAATSIPVPPLPSQPLEDDNEDPTPRTGRGRGGRGKGGNRQGTRTRAQSAPANTTDSGISDAGLLTSDDNQPRRQVRRETRTSARRSKK